MEKDEILRKAAASLHALVTSLSGVSDGEFFRKGDNNKWSAAQTVQHLVLAVRPLNLAFSLPLFTLRMFGKPSRQSASFDQLVERYQRRLIEGARASGPFIPDTNQKERARLIGRLVNAYEKFRVKVQAIPEKDLDGYLMPHPILGKITIREMLFFTAYHIQHHHSIVKERLSK